MKKDINFVPLYSVGKIIKSEKTINCAFCEKEIKTQKETVVHQKDNFFHPQCYKVTKCQHCKEIIKKGEGNLSTKLHSECILKFMEDLIIDY